MKPNQPFPAGFLPFGLFLRLFPFFLGFDQLEPFGKLPIRIPNRALDGFVDFFKKKHDCRMGCRDCRYCDDFAASVSILEDKGRNDFVNRVGRAIDRFESGAFRTASGK